MGKQLPEDWINGKKTTLNVFSDLGLKCDVTNLYIYKNKALKTKNLLWRWKPLDEEDDIRPNAGRPTDSKGNVELDKNGNKKKRRYYGQESTYESDPFAAGKEAILLLKKLKQEIEEEKRTQKYNSTHSLHHYWESFYKDFCQEYGDVRGGQNRINNTLLKWEGGDYGLGLQEWSKKCITDIDYNDLRDYWKLLDERGANRTPPSDMAGTKKQQKTLLNKLFEEARITDFPQLPNPTYPPIKSKGKDSVEWLRREEWDELVKLVIELSGGIANKIISKEEYQQLEWTDRDRKNQRNYVDFYDALMTQYYFYVRAEDIPRLRMEWFREEGKGEGERGILYMRELKGNREKDNSYAYREGELNHIRRMKSRKPDDGWSWFPQYQRTIKNPKKATLKCVNHLLQESLKTLGIEKREAMTWTNLRHTAFVLMIEDNPDLRATSELIDFAKNGFTSLDQFQKTYLDKMDVERRASESRKKVKAGKYDLIKRIEIH